MLVAVEMGAVLSRYGKAMAEETRCGFRVFTYDMGEYLLYVIGSGAGEIAAAAACQLLIDRYEAELVVNTTTSTPAPTTAPCPASTASIRTCTCLRRLSL